jgi:hypothetical protein
MAVNIKITRVLLYWDVTQCRLVVSYRHFGTPYQFYLQGSSSPRRNHQPTTEMTKGRDLRRAQVNIPWSFLPFLH